VCGQLGNKRLRLNDEQRRRLAVKAKELGWRVLHELTTIVTPDKALNQPITQSIHS
jgi:hypothetical protein